MFEYFYKAELVSVYDGDTLTCHIDLGFGLQKQKTKIRLAGINAPEMRGENKEHALESRNWLKEQFLKYGNQFVLRTKKNRSGLDRQGKYGRYLGIVYLKGRNLNHDLLEQGFAERWHDWESWVLLPVDKGDNKDSAQDYFARFLT